MSSSTSARHRHGTAPGSSLLAGVLAGLAAAVAGVGCAHLVAGLVAPSSSPVTAIGSAAIDLTPTPVKEWVVATFGTADKPVLVSGIVAVTLVIAAAAGALTRRVRALGVVVFVGLAGLAAWAALGRPGAAPIDLVPSLVAAAVGVATLLWLDHLSGRAGGSPPAYHDASRGGKGPTMIGPGSRPTTRGVARRAFLVASAGSVLLGGVAAVVGQRLTMASVRVARALPRPGSALPELPTGIDAQVPGVTPLRTPQANFYRVDTALVVPRIDAASWRLSIDGDVERPFSLSYDELLALPMIERDITLTCVSNEVGGEYAGGARWLGVPVADLLRRAGVRAGADQILSTSSDGYTCSTPTAALLDDREALVAFGMNGEALDPTHGFPARLVTPGLYGYVGATKWLTTLTATTFAAEQAYWTKRGWAAQAPIKTMTRIDTPAALRRVDAGRVAIGGIAWAQRRGIDGVEVQIDDGPWQAARLGPDVNIDYWRQWWFPWDATPGQHTLRARSVDGTGAVQSQELATPFPNGASGYHEIVVSCD